jgi:hypothetical protein
MSSINTRPYDYDRFEESGSMNADSYPPSPSLKNGTSALTEVSIGGVPRSPSSTTSLIVKNGISSPSDVDLRAGYVDKEHDEYPFKSDDLSHPGSDELLTANAAPARNSSRYQDLGGWNQCNYMYMAWPC